MKDPNKVIENIKKYLQKEIEYSENLEQLYKEMEINEEIVKRIKIKKQTLIITLNKLEYLEDNC